MKRFLILLSMLCCSMANAQTETINWYIDGQTYATTTCLTGDDIILPQNAPSKYGYTFQGWAAFTKVLEYIESTGSQYIDTGIKQHIQSDLRFVLEYTPNNQTNYIGANYWLEIPMSILTVGIKNLVVATLKDGQVIVTVNDIVKRSTSVSTVANGENFPILLFALGGWGGYTQGKLHSAKIYDSNILVRDFIPVTDENDIPCLFDKITYQFFYNQGRGIFVAGPEINQ